MSAAPGTGSLHPELLVSRSVRPISAASSCSACGVASHAYPCGYSQVLVSWIPAQRCVPPTQCCSSTVNTWGLPGRAQADCQGVILSEHVLGVFVATTRPPLQHWTPLALCKCTGRHASPRMREGTIPVCAALQSCNTSLGPVHCHETQTGTDASRRALLCEALHGMAGNSACHEHAHAVWPRPAPLAFLVCRRSACRWHPRLGCQVCTSRGARAAHASARARSR